MDSYQFFFRAVVFGSIIDVIPVLDHAGSVSICNSKRLLQYHAGADTVAFISTSLTRDVVLALTNENLSIEAALVSLLVLARSEYTGSSDAIHIEMPHLHVKGFISGERSNSTRIKLDLLKNGSVTFTPVSVSSTRSSTGVFSFNNKKYQVLTDPGEQQDSDTVCAFYQIERDRLELLSVERPVSLATLLPVIQHGIDLEIFYHTLTLSFAGSEVALVYQASEKKFTISTATENLF